MDTALARIVLIIVVATAFPTATGADIVVVDIGGSGGADSVGAYTSLGVVAGFPAISYQDVTNRNLMYVRALDSIGSAWGSPATLDTSPDTGYSTSLAVVTGNPAICYYDRGSMDLMYVRALDSTGSAWGPPVTVDSAGDVGEHCSLAVVDGRPAISYGEGADNLRYVRALDDVGASCGTPVVVDSVLSVGYFTSLAVIDGFPAIAYLDISNGGLKFVRASDGAGVAWQTPVVLDDPPEAVGQYNSLAVVDGFPAVAYWDQTNRDLKFVRAQDAQGAVWNPPIVVASIGSIGRFASMAVIAGLPGISYWDEGEDDLKYVESLDSDGGSWPLTHSSVDADGQVGRHTSLTEVGGEPAISYWDETNGDLKFAQGATVSVELLSFVVE